MNNYRHARLSGVIVTASLSLLLVGCGINAGTNGFKRPTAPVRGMVHGGPNPIVGATVTLYETQVGVGS
jgi:hypothetical protein